LSDLNVKQMHELNTRNAPLESSWFKLQMVTIDMRYGVVQTRCYRFTAKNSGKTKQI
jgi:hypothetical protein